MEDKNLGYVSLWRKIQNNRLWLLEPFTKGQAWVDLFMLANHKTGSINIRGNIIEVKRGQLGWSEEKLADRWKWSRGKVKRYLNYLETIQQIIQQKSYIISLITVINYDKYQKNSTADDTSDSTTDGHQTVQQTDTNNNVNNKNNPYGDKSPDNKKPMDTILLDDNGDVIESPPIPKKYGKKKGYAKIAVHYMTLLGKTGNALRFFPAIKEIYELYQKDFPEDTEEQAIEEITARIDIAHKHYTKAKCKDWGLGKVAENWNKILTEWNV